MPSLMMEIFFALILRHTGCQDIISGESLRESMGENRRKGKREHRHTEQLISLMAST